MSVHRMMPSDDARRAVAGGEMGFPWPSLPDQAQFKSFEEADARKMAEVLFFESGDAQQWEARNLQLAHFISMNVGADRFLPCVGLPTESSTASLSGRMLSFPSDWTSWSRLDMALCGLYWNPRNDKVACFQCRVEFRGLDMKGMDPWLYHQRLAPNCLQLKRYKSIGPLPTPKGKRLRRNSASDTYDLIKPKAATMHN